MRRFLFALGALFATEAFAKLPPLTNQEIKQIIIDAETTYHYLGMVGLKADISVCYDKVKGDSKRYCGYFDLWSAFSYGQLWGGDPFFSEEAVGDRIHRNVPEFKKATEKQVVKSMNDVLIQFVRIAEKMPARSVEEIINDAEKRECSLSVIKNECF